MADYACQDCTRCSRSGFMTLVRGLGAIASLGVSELVIGTGDFLKRSCPGCGHPMSEHTISRLAYRPPYYGTQSAPGRHCHHVNYSRSPKGNVKCHDCGDLWDADGHRWDRHGVLY